jgi:hypothetical protein
MWERLMQKVRFHLNENYKIYKCFREYMDMNIKEKMGSKYYYMPRKYAHDRLYSINHNGKKINWKNPKTLDEKIHILTTTYGKRESLFADKVKVREYVAYCGYKDLLPKLYGTWKNTKEINLTSLPKQFVLKTNHASGGNFIVICKDKDEINWEKEFEHLEESMHINFAKQYCEYQYAYINPVVLAEELLDDGKEERMIDYKIHCFNGEPYCIQVNSNRAGKEVKRNTYDFSWNELDFITKERRSDKTWVAPKSLDVMYKAAKKLSTPFKYARIDFYDVDGKAFFGEITLSSAGGNLKFLNNEAQLKLGNMINL